MKWLYRVKNMQGKRLPAIVDRFVWKKRTKHMADRRNKKEIMSIDDGRGYKTKVSDMIELREKKALKQKVDEEEHLKLYGGLREGI